MTSCRYLDPEAVLEEDPEETVARLRRRFRAIDNQFGVSDLNLDEVVEFRKPYFGKIAKP